jgi:hypothetical protein
MQIIRKPRVFLSHSKKDIAFIHRLEGDLRNAQCEPWIDEVELRSGRPWLDQIFGDGIPSCEVVLCYFTANSAESKVFMQELDARLIERLHSARVALLLYVSSGDLRSRMRLDLQRLQAPEINEQNYSSAFPRLVAEVWRCYAESLILTGIESERVKRLEAELRIKELESASEPSVFTTSEQAEFRTIWSQINRTIEFSASIIKKQQPPTIRTDRTAVDTATSATTELPETRRFLLDLGALFRSTVSTQKFQPSGHATKRRVESDALLILRLDENDWALSFQVPTDIDAELLRFGFVERHYTPAPPSEGRLARFAHQPFKLMFTPKFDRFCFWLEHSLGSHEVLTLVVRPI